MPYSRMNSRTIFMNDDKNYQREFFNKRNIKQTPQYRTGRFQSLTPTQRAQLQPTSLVWGATSNLTKIAHEFYGDAQYWWVIALYNNTPLEADFRVGQVVYIPLPLQQVLSYYGV
jgi:hypothetical protein